MKIAFIRGVRDHGPPLQYARAACGDLCDSSRQTVPWSFLNYTVTDIDCHKLFRLMKDIEANSEKYSETPSWTEDILEHRRRQFTTERGFRFADYYFSRQKDAVAQYSHFDKHIFEDLKDRIDGGKAIGYPDAARLVAEAADKMNITNKTVLVIGTEVPWMETILLQRKPRKGVTVEYTKMKSDIEGWEFWTPSQMMDRFLDGMLEKFDFVFTYSSVEHTGLGRYGDSLNPWGDMMTVAGAWCVTTDEAQMAIGVPVTRSVGPGVLAFNAHRIYSADNYPYLMTNWKYDWRPEHYSVVHSGEEDDWRYQPLYVFSKV